MEPKSPTLKYTPLMVFQIILLVLYFVFVRYEEKEPSPGRGFEDTHVMIFIGFGFLMTFLKKYSYSAVGVNLLLASLVIQWAILCQNFFTMKDNTIFIDKKSLLEGDIMSATVLITFGALIGFASVTQLLFIAVIETVIGCLNLWLINDVFQASDVGGSIAIHTYGAYFGLGASLMFRSKKTDAEVTPTSLKGPSYTSDITSMIGTIFLWIYWPSFNSALAGTEAEYQRAIINTYLSLGACTVTSFVMSSVVSHGKFEMEHIQNSTLAGGVAVGAVSNMMIGPGGAIAVGIASGVLSVLGFRYLTPKLAKMGLLDTCGVNNLHGMPGVLSGLLSILFAGIATKDAYNGNEGLVSVFPAMTERTAPNQALYQFIAVLVTIVLALGAGAITGFIANTGLFKKPTEEEKYNDECNWELPS